MGKQYDDSLFSQTDYRNYVRAWAQARGRGEFRKISLALDVHTTLISQILSGRKSLTEEQAGKLCLYMGLNPLETDYFLKLIQRERAGTEFLKTVYSRHLVQLQQQAKEIKSRVPESKILSAQDRALFYSSWQYSVVRLLTSLPDFQTKEKIALRLDLSVSRVQEILDFLVSRGLCKETQGRFVRTEQNTHVEAGSPLAVRHHQNWRAKAMNLQESMTPEDLALTAPLSIALKDVPKVRKMLLEAIADVVKVVDKSPAEELVYLGIDWIRM